MSKKVKVVGYSQEVKTSNGISYRNFSDSLVGNQFTSDAGATLFTLGNFRVTTNLDPKVNKLYRTSQFSKYFTLNNLGQDDELGKLIHGLDVKLNLDRTDIRNYAYFGSFREFVRISLENIITIWPASIYLDSTNQITPSSPNLTFENAVYSDIKLETTFKVNINSIKNDFGVNIKKNGTILNTFNEGNQLRDLTTAFNHYNLVINDIEYPIIDFTGYDVDNYVNLVVKGNPFGGNTSGTTNYHIKPTNQKFNLFFLQLNDFESHLLNRDTSYKADFTYNYESENGNTIIGKKSVKWPVSDGYNIDFQSEYYVGYVNKLLEIADLNDANKSNIIVNRLVSSSILEWDTIDQKMSKTLNVYGRNFDEVKKYATGIKFANVVTYDKKNNVPDSLVKNLARTLGWELTTSLFNVDFNDNFLSSGKGMNITPVESEIEFWRRLIINSPWVWKSKGTRKVIEFLLKFIGTPNGLVTFNEHVYKASNKVDIEEVKKIFELNNQIFNEDDVVVDSDGYPKVLVDNNNMYFQKGGLWYRQTGGEDSNIDILTGNNPHVGPYDSGYEYVHQFNSVIPNFETVTVSNINIYTTTNNTYTNNDLGKFDSLLGTTPTPYIEILSSTNNQLDDCVIVSNEIIESPKPNPKYDAAGELIETNGAQASFKISVVRNESAYVNPCDYVSFSLDVNGLILFTHTDNSQDYNITGECCTGLGYSVDVDALGRSVCRWKEVSVDPCSNFQMTTSLDNSGYVLWTNLETGAITNVVPELECCTNENLTYESNGGGYSCKEVVVEPVAPCDGYDFTGKYEVLNNKEYALFTNNGVISKAVPSVECCEVLGFDSELSNGQLSCLKPIENCDSFTINSINSKGYVIFKNSSDILVESVNDAECCTNNGYVAEVQTDGTFKCHEEVVDSGLPKLTLVSRVGGFVDGSIMNMKIEGEANTTIKYRVSVVDVGDHGFINSLNGGDGSIISPSSPTPIVGSYCEGSIKLDSTGFGIVVMETTAKPPLRTDVNSVSLEFSIFNYDYITIEDTNKLINSANSSKY